MRAQGVRQIAFSSTGSVYGEPEVFPTPEDAPFPIQTSLYGASKLAGEGLIAAYAAGYGFTGVIFRFVSILGERYTHGHVFDFYCALKRDPTRLRVLGDGRQEKSYLYVGDCVAAMLTAIARHDAGDRARTSTTSAPTRPSSSTIRSRSSPSTSGSRPADRAHRRPARLDRRQPADRTRHRRASAASAGARRSTIREARRYAPWSGSRPTSTPGAERSVW